MSGHDARRDESHWLDLRRRCLANQEGAWAELDVELRPIVRAWLRRHTSDQTLVDDLTQEFFLRLYEDGGRRLALFDPGRGVPLLGYLRVVAIRVHHDWSRSRHGLDRQRWVNLSEVAEIPVHSGEDPVLRHRLETALEALSEDDRVVLRLCAEGLSYAQIAKAVGLSEGGAAARISRARARLRESLGYAPLGPVRRAPATSGGASAQTG